MIRNSLRADSLPGHKPSQWGVANEGIHRRAVRGAGLSAAPSLLAAPIRVLPIRVLPIWVLPISVLLASPAVARTQDTEPQPGQSSPGNLAPASAVTVRGMVRNAATGEPLPRALVRIEGDADTGALTDGEGRFEIPALAAGPQLFEVIKPGFQDGGADTLNMGSDSGSADAAHNVIVAAGMPELDFTLAPNCAIGGHVELSTGDPAQGIEVQLLRRTVQDGRGVWQSAAATKTLSDGSYRFAGLPGGRYVVYTRPTLDSEAATDFIAEGRAAHVVLEGYASVFFPDARDLADASWIQLRNGEQVQANLSLTLEPFHTVNATAFDADGKPAPAADEPDHAGASYSAQITDAQGHQLPYLAPYDQKTRTVQALLPDGTYSILLTATPHGRFLRLSRGEVLDSLPQVTVPMSGSVEFTVSGHALPNLRIPLSPSRTGEVQFNFVHSASSGPAPAPAQPRSIVVTASQAAGLFADGAANALAQGDGSGPMETSFLPPGQYWVHTLFAQKGICEESFTAGGANLAREPLVLSLSGASAPMELTVRDDCAKLSLSLPAALAGISTGEEPFYTVYVVPDFESTADVEPLTLRPTSGATVTVDGLTPGSYHVYTFLRPVALEYRNRDVLASLPDPGQEVTLSPGATSNLVLEAPGH
jgi:hypothetical protein